MRNAMLHPRATYMLIRIAAATVLAVVLIAGGFLIYAHESYPTTSAANVLSDMLHARQHPHAALRGETMAFLPYWRLNNISYARYDLLSEVNFFSLTVGPDGHIVHVTGNQTEPGWRWWNTQQVLDLIPEVQIDGGRFGLTLAILNNADIRAVLRSSAAQQNLIADALAQVHARHLDAVTLDVEYAGTPPAALRQEFTTFAQRFSSGMRQQASGTTLSVTLTPRAGRDPGLFDLLNLSRLFDRFIGMTYDFYNGSSSQAGPNAPMRGYAGHRFAFDVTTAYRDYLQAIPRSKIVMGVPFSGWDWAVRRGKGLLARVLPPRDPNSYAAILSYGRMRTFAALKRGQCGWDRDAQEPYCRYTDPRGVQHEVWFENDRSVAARYAYARANGFGGIAIWVLGYDAGYPDLWNILRQTFTA